jgi:two-component system, OmpR family, sensor histidine kinase KdpD
VSRFPVRAALLWGAVLVLATVVMLAVRPSLDKAHVALVLLLVVLGGSSAGGRLLGVTLAAVSFVVFNWFFITPYSTLIIANPLDWLVLVAFLVTGIVAAQLLYMAREEARVARERADEIDRLASLGAETLSVGSAADSLAAVADVVRRSTGVERCDVYTSGHMTEPVTLSASGPAACDADRSLVEWVKSSGSAAVERRDGTVHLHGAFPSAAELASLRTGAAFALLLPLQARDRIVGVLRVASASGLRIDEPRWRFLHAMSYYVALAVERVRLMGEAEHAEALRQSEKLKDALLASVSHDLRTPLTTIKALAHDLGALGDERSEIIEQEADRLNRSVADLLDLSRLNAGAMPLRIELNAVDDLLGALVQRVEPAIGADRLRILLPPDDALLLGNFDFVHSLRIVANLVENAAKYSPPESAIEVAASREGLELAIEVRDRGPGLPESEVDRAFDAFYRPATTAPDVSGAGLGLSIARRLAEAQGGSLTYHARPGGGSAFVLRLPAADVTLPPDTSSTDPPIFVKA